MNRRLLTLLAFVLAVVNPVVRAADDDPIRAKLEKAKEVYGSDLTKYRNAINGWFDRREEAARKNGDKKTIDQIKAERQAFADCGESPKSVPPALKAQLTTARGVVESAYKLAVREYTKARRDDDATRVEKELDAFKNGTTRPSDAARLGDKYYKVFDTPVTWHEAKKRCEGMGGTLAIITSEEENGFVTKLTAASKSNVVWLGATDERTEGKWVWGNGKAVEYANWDRPHQPNNAGMIEHYAVLLAKKNGVWWDYPSNATAHPNLTGNGIPGFVCQWD